MIFALFSNKTSQDEKSQLASRILTFESNKPVHWNEEPETGQDGYKLGKPILELDLTPGTELVDLVGSNSFLLWDILGLDWN